METTLADSSCPGLTRASTSYGIPENEDVDGRAAMTERATVSMGERISALPGPDAPRALPIDKILFQLSATGRHQQRPVLGRNGHEARHRHRGNHEARGN